MPRIAEQCVVRVAMCEDGAVRRRAVPNLRDAFKCLRCSVMPRSVLREDVLPAAAEDASADKC
jgi:hypothetical protein